MRILFISLGCDKNLADSEMMLGDLVEHGHFITDNEEEAEAVVVNTCCFINDAKEESVNTLLEMAELRENGSIQALLVTGCLAERYREEITKEIPQIDAVLGTMAIDRICEVLDQIIMTSQKQYIFPALDSAPYSGKKRVVTTGGHYAYLKIAEGCDKHCTYCIIPKVRGNYRSIPMEALLEQARELGEKGVRELILVAQETTIYGMDLYGKKMLSNLLRKLCEISSLKWIRIMYTYPEEIDDELIQVMKEESKICHYLDMPIQHASDRILKNMGRRTTRKDIELLIGKLRSVMPDIILRTSLISGFPGETEDDHIELYQFVNQTEFDRLGVFAYSMEEDTPAAQRNDQITEEVKCQRRDELMELQQEIAFEKAENMTGCIFEVMIEGRLTDDDVYVGRTYMDAPGVDGYLFVNTSRNLNSGDFIKVQITGSHEYDLIGVPVDESAEKNQ